MRAKKVKLNKQELLETMLEQEAIITEYQQRVEGLQGTCDRLEQELMHVKKQITEEQKLELLIGKLETALVQMA